MNNKLTDEQRWCPDVDPITRYPLFMWIHHPELGYVPTYGGPYDSYTLTECDSNGEFFRHRYDHDFGGWVEDEYIGVIVVEDWLPKNQDELDEYVKDNPPAELQERRKADGAAPTISIIYKDGRPEPNSAAAIVGAAKLHDGVHEFYATPPAPVVPDEYVRDASGKMMLNGKCEPRIGFGSGWNACRKAMLQVPQQIHQERVKSCLA